MLAWVLVASLSLAADPVSWSALDATVAEAWDQGQGAAATARADGARDARRAVALPLDSVFAQLEPDPRPDASPWEGLQLALQLTVGDQRGAARARWAAEAAQAEAAAAEARLAFGGDVRAAWLAGWVAVEMADHLDAFADDLGALLDAPRAARAAGVLAPAALEDLEVEIGRLRREAAGARVEAADAQGRLSSLLGRAVRLDPTGMPDLEGALPAQDDPWDPLRAQLATHPRLRALATAEQLALAEARAARSAPRALVGGGVSLRSDASGGVRAVPLVLLQVPLSNPQAPEARAQRAEADALSRELAWARQRLEAAVEASSTAWQAAVDRVETLQTAAEAPLRRRLDRLEEALGAGAIDATPVLLAIRDLHEAHHEHALAVADLVARRAHAEALARELTRSTP